MLRIFFVFLCLGIFGLMGCQTAPKEPDMVAVEWPTLEVNLSPETPQKQSVGNIEVIASINTFKREIGYNETRSKPYTSAWDGSTSIQVTKTPRGVLKPSNVQFQITIQNKMTKVLRLGLSVLQVQIDGKNMTLSPLHTAEFMAGLVLPSQTSSFIIQGPEISELPEKKEFPIGCFIYDLPIETDAAGNPTKRENVQFYFLVKRGTPVKEMHPKETKTMYLAY